jgi:DNA-binding MarR family transcriptional regulator
MAQEKRQPTRDQILQELARVGRENSDATVLFHAAMAKLLDLHPTDYKALGVLERRGAMSAGEIARITGLATASVTNLVDRLEQKGFVRRKHDPSDRRRILVEAIADRVTSARPLFASTTRSLARLFRRYSEADLAVIADFLGRNAERLREETRKLESMPPAAGEARR